MKARLAALAFMPLPLVPFVAGGLTVLATRDGPPPGCFEYCDFDRGVAQVGLVIGVIGLVVVFGVWNRSVAAMALALFVSSLVTLISLVSILLGLGMTGADLFAFWPWIGALVVGGVPTVLLVAALAEQVDAAGVAARRSV